ncbi:hypothetical protein D0T57_10895 [Dysgonomonas sp. 511]|nr:hypothetical protein [Dysgonomonas sp. 511]
MIKLKIFAFHFFAYILINVCFWGVLKYQQKTTIAIISGDASLGMFVSLMIVFSQVFLGLFLSIVYALAKKIGNKPKILLFILVNFSFVLFFTNINTSESLHIYTISIFLLFSMLYFFFVKKH